MDSADNNLRMTLLKFWLGFSLISMLVLLLVIVLLFSQNKKVEGEDSAQYTFDESISAHIEENQDLFTGYVVHSLYNSFKSPESGFRFENNLVSVSDTAIYRFGYYSVNCSA